jgi:hypothetical protein
LSLAFIGNASGQDSRGEDVAAEALYWAGVSKYKATNDPSPLRQADRELKERYPESSWAKKASVWGG